MTQVNSDTSLSDSCVIITGVSGQLGIAYTQSLLAKGATVVGIDKIQPNLDSLLSYTESENFLFVQADVTSKESLKSALEEILDKVGVPTVLINNAAIDSPPSSPPEENGPYETYPDDSWDRVLSVNLTGVHYCCQVFGAAMANAEKGSIINIASIYGMVSPDQSLYDYRRLNGEDFFKPAAYSASKSGILNLTRYLAIYWAKQNVRVNSLSLAGVFNNQDQEFLDAYCARIPIGRMADPLDYIGPVIFLAGEGSKYMTGHNMVVDGGWTAI
jgi:NAD(P)-dependent dehydrogenase (short-subunit alcohol dehydrogenase family)